MSEYTATIHVTEYPPHLKHKVIFETFNQLEESQSLLIVNDHDPKPLHFQFQSMFPNGFEWEYVEQGPEIFRVKIKKGSV